MSRKLRTSKIQTRRKNDGIQIFLKVILHEYIYT